MCCCLIGYAEDYWLFFKISAFILLKFRKWINGFFFNAFFKVGSVHKSEEFQSVPSPPPPCHQLTLCSWVMLFLFKGCTSDNNLPVKWCCSTSLMSLKHRDMVRTAWKKPTDPNFSKCCDMYLKLLNDSQHRIIYVDTSLCLYPSLNLLLKDIMKLDIIFFLKKGGIQVWNK